MSNKNKSKLIKRLITGAMCLTLVFSINGFASVVSDNDGSAFITKAEFDSLKNNFQSQIDQYNQSIDSKIDGAIAAYLAGIQVVTARSLPNYIVKLNRAANTPYKWWTDELKIGTGEEAKYGYYGGFYTQTQGGAANKAGTFFGRASADGANTQTSFDWKQPTGYKREKFYLIDQKNNAFYLSGDAKEFHIRRGFYFGFSVTSTTVVPAAMLGSNYMSKTADYTSTVCDLRLHLDADIANAEEWHPNFDTSQWKTDIIKTTKWSIINKVNNREIDDQFDYLGQKLHVCAETKSQPILIFNLTDEEKNLKSTTLLPRFDDNHIPMYITSANEKTIALAVSSISEAEMQNTTNNVEANVGIRSYGAYTYKNSAGNWITAVYANTNTANAEKINFKFQKHKTRQYNVKEFIDKDATEAYGDGNVKGYEGALVCKNDTSSENEIKIKFNFKSRNNTSEGLKFALRDEKFTETTALTPNVDTTFTNWVTTTDTPQEVTLKLGAQKELWIQLAPTTSGKFVGVEVVGDIIAKQID